MARFSRIAALAAVPVAAAQMWPVAVEPFRNLFDVSNFGKHAGSEDAKIVIVSLATGLVMLLALVFLASRDVLPGGGRWALDLLGAGLALMAGAAAAMSSTLPTALPQLQAAFALCLFVGIAFLAFPRVLALLPGAREAAGAGAAGMHLSLPTIITVVVAWGVPVLAVLFVTGAHVERTARPLLSKLPPDAFFATSSERGWLPASARFSPYSGSGAWRAQQDDAKPYWQVTFPHPVMVTAIHTAGRPGTDWSGSLVSPQSQTWWNEVMYIKVLEQATYHASPHAVNAVSHAFAAVLIPNINTALQSLTSKATTNEWVASYRLVATSPTGHEFDVLADGGSTLHTGNHDRHDRQINEYFEPFVAKKLRIEPVDVSNRATLRVEVYGYAA